MGGGQFCSPQQQLRGEMEERAVRYLYHVWRNHGRFTIALAYFEEAFSVGEQEAEAIATSLHNA